MASITILMENTVRRQGLTAEHGLSLWVECEDGPILFDAGQTDAWATNARKMGIDTTRAATVLLSHGHYDHGGGMAAFPFDQKGAALYAHPSAFRPKFSRRNPGEPAAHAIGLDWGPEDIRAWGGSYKPNEGVAQIGAHTFAVTAIPHTTSFEPDPWEFEVETPEGIRLPDLIEEEQMLVLSLPDGLAVVVGCSHPGVINGLERVRSEFPGRPIRTVVGGTHLEKAGPERIQATADWFLQHEIRLLAPLHCTGARTQCALLRALGDRVALVGVGDTIQL